MSPLAVLITTGLALFISFLLAALKSAIDHLPKADAYDELKKQRGRFFYLSLQRRMLGTEEVEHLRTALYYGQYVGRFIYVTGVSWLCLRASREGQSIELNIAYMLLAFALLVLISDLLPRVWGSNNPKKAISFTAPLSTFPLSFLLPLTYLMVSGIRRFGSSTPTEEDEEIEGHVKERILELIESNRQEMSPEDRKLIESVLTFRSRIVREVMVPRVDMFAIPVDTTLGDAAHQLHEQGYSRVPVFRQNMDDIAGILMYRDVLIQFMDAGGERGEQVDLKQSIESIVMPVLYTPETKRISHLLQEFRSKQMHMAVVVDEYGGTAGIVTIEDILEELVGEIADEYDTERRQYQPLPSGGWMADARMSILDAEEQLGIKIPQDGDYDTIGGYIFHRAGTIPSEGFIIMQDNFEIKILKSDERKVDKVSIVPVRRHHEPRKDQHKGDAS